MFIFRSAIQLTNCTRSSALYSHFKKLSSVTSTEIASTDCQNDGTISKTSFQSSVLSPSQKKAWVQELEKSIKYPDYFNVAEMFSVEDLFNARVHLGHREGTLNEYMVPYLFGSRLSHLVFDLDQTADHLRRALNFIGHLSYREGIIVFASRNHQLQYAIEEIAKNCGEYAHCREWKQGVFTNSTKQFRGVVRLPDCLLLLSTHDTLLERHWAIHDSSKMRIPTVGIVDSNVDPRLVSYPIPGNDDSPQSVLYIANLFASLITRVKRKREDFFSNLPK